MFMGHYSKQGHTVTLYSWIWKIRKLTCHHKPLVLEAIFPWPSSQEENHCSVTPCPTAFLSLQITFPLLPSVLVFPGKSGVKLTKHWSVHSCFNEADKCPLPTGAILEGRSQATRCGERARHEAGGGRSRHVLPDDVG